MLGAGAIVEQNALRGAQMLIARATDIGVPSVPRFGAGRRSNLLSRRDLKRAIGFRADLDGAFGAMGPGKGERC
jgi:hypothetical protein